MIKVSRLCLGLICLLLACGATGPASAQDVAIAGQELLRDGRSWVPRGLDLDAWSAPSGYERNPAYARAKQTFGAAEFQAMRSFGADLVRLEVSQQAIDPRADDNPPAGWSAAKARTYLNRVTGAVRALRRYGFVVQLQLNDNKLSYFGPGRDYGAGVPDSATVRAWRILAPIFAADPGVMYGLFNEPYINRNDPNGWNEWQATSQPVIAAIRQVGARNVVVVEGVAASRQLANRFGSAAGRLRDPDGALLYGVHPYFDYTYRPPENTSNIWDANFGNFSRTHPVIADEWSVGAYLQSGCRLSAPHDTTQFFDYLSRHGIGLVAWAWDVGSAIQSNYPRPTYPPTLTSYRGFSCQRPARGGPGEMLHAYYLRRGVLQY